jgi:hypothetical protein
MKPKYLMLVASVMIALAALGQNGPKADNDLPPGSPQLIQPEDLVKAMQSASAQKPVVLYVGPHLFYAQAHIPGAEDMGPTAKPEGLEKLRLRAKSLPHDGFVVIYCGCCPWDHCPNIRPAYHELEKMGFTRLRVLYLANSFGTNWVDKGYSVAKGE